MSQNILVTNKNVEICTFSTALYDSESILSGILIYVEMKCQIFFFFGFMSIKNKKMTGAHAQYYVFILTY